MNIDYNEIVDRLLDMNPDPIPEFVLLKEFKGYAPERAEYQNAYDRICSHPFVKRFEKSQNDRGFWSPFHGCTEGVIRHLLSYGLDKNHSLLKNASEYIVKLLNNEQSLDQFEKQDNIRWWPETFISLVSAAMLSLIDNANENLVMHRNRWMAFAETAFRKGSYDREINWKTQNEHFGFETKCIIPPFNYYNLLLLSPRGGGNHISGETDNALVNYCLNEASSIGYVYNEKPGEMISINAQNRDSRDFCHWVRALSLVAQYTGWTKHEKKYVDWILKQRNRDGLWEFPKKFDFVLSNLWRGNNKAIDSTIFVLRFLLKKQAF